MIKEGLSARKKKKKIKNKITYKGCNVLKAINLFHFGIRYCVLILEDERDLYYPRCPSSHERVPKDRVYMSAQLQMLRMCAHAPSREHDN